jgi:4-aminobutyrate aminotransferase / (S)-3-amino-2-methylpropionate transaminase / 5-aminovalerate transaminase
MAHEAQQVDGPGKGSRADALSPADVQQLGTPGADTLDAATGLNGKPVLWDPKDGFRLSPMEVPSVHTQHRCICTALPVPDSLAIFDREKLTGARSMGGGQAPVVWEEARDVYVRDRWGNQWIDLTAAVLLANAGHGVPEIIDAIKAAADKLAASYCYPTEGRAVLTEMLCGLMPEPSAYKAFLLTTGSEAVECAIKLSFSYAKHRNESDRRFFVSFEGDFHGRTLGAQLTGGWPGLKSWIGQLDDRFVQVPFPDGYRTKDVSFDGFLRALSERGIQPHQIAGVMTESYQAVGVNFMPAEYAQALQAFCRKHGIVLTFDEVQAGFGRSGKMFTYEHYGVQPDLVLMGKGITSSLPLSAVVGRSEPGPSEMTSTHGGTPLSVAAAIANINYLQEHRLVENSAQMGEVLMRALRNIQGRYPEHIGAVHGRGLVAALHFVHPGTEEPDPRTAMQIAQGCFDRGVLVPKPFNLIKIAPPLSMGSGPLLESLDVLNQAIAAAIGH